jgi:predicted ribosome quality control (RQC) complex YloA/Tae2 family protein
LSLNWKEINLILDELNLPGMQIQKIYQSSFDVLAMELYGKLQTEKGGAHLLLVSLSPLACRFHETFRAVPKSEKPLRFAEFLKSRILNGRIEEALQLGDNRVIRITIRRGESLYRLYIRLWSNAANVILADENNMILDAMKRLPGRGETGGKIYKPELPGQLSQKIFEIRDLPGEGSFNKRIDDWYTEQGGTLSLKQLREEVQRIIGKNRSRLETALERLREKETDYAGGDKYREYGDLILSNTASLSRGTPWLEIADTNLLRIELDPRKSPAENAAHYYEKYRKTKSGLGELREEIAESELELIRLAEQEKQLLAETNPLRLDSHLKKLRGKSYSGKADKKPGLSFADDGWLILVGRDAAENDTLLRHHVKGNDLWLHVRDWAGSYVFIKQRQGKTVPLEILLDAGNLALFYSRGRNNNRRDL